MQLKLLAPTKVEMQFLMLRFLKSESWSNTNNLCELLQISSRLLTGVLSPMIKEKLIKSVMQQIMGGETQLYGITNAGYICLAEHEKSINGLSALGAESKHEMLTHRISPTFVPHRLDIQMLKIRAERAGWTNWITADLGRTLITEPLREVQVGASHIEGSFRPDAWCTDLSGQRVCVECERTMKSKIRYSQILCNYLLALKRGEFERVIWVCPEQKLKQNLQSVITSITHVEIGSLEIVVPRNRFDQFSFMTFDEWAT